MPTKGVCELCGRTGPANWGRKFFKVKKKLSVPFGMLQQEIKLLVMVSMCIHLIKIISIEKQFDLCYRGPVQYTLHRARNILRPALVGESNNQLSSWLLCSPVNRTGTLVNLMYKGRLLELRCIRQLLQGICPLSH